MDPVEALDAELELITSSLLPAERLTSSDPAIWPRSIEIVSDDSKFSLHVSVDPGYPRDESLVVEVKGKEMGRDEAEGWRAWVDARMGERDVGEEYPLYHLLTTHLLPILAPSSPSPPSSPVVSTPDPPSTPHHVLLTSHHLLSPTKRKYLLALSSQLSLVGFSKTGHPGIMYAIGQHDDLVEWLKEVKRWNWLALRVRIGVEPVLGEPTEDGSKEKEDGARRGKGRGDWEEVEKINEALDWLRKRGREDLLFELGMGGGPGR